MWFCIRIYTSPSFLLLLFYVPFLHPSPPLPLITLSLFLHSLPHPSFLSLFLHISLPPYSPLSLPLLPSSPHPCCPPHSTPLTYTLTHTHPPLLTLPLTLSLSHSPTLLGMSTEYPEVRRLVDSLARLLKPLLDLAPSVLPVISNTVTTGTVQCVTVYVALYLYIRVSLLSFFLFWFSTFDFFYLRSLFTIRYSMEISWEPWNFDVLFMLIYFPFLSFPCLLSCVFSLLFFSGVQENGVTQVRKWQQGTGVIISTASVNTAISDTDRSASKLKGKLNNYCQTNNYTGMPYFRTKKSPLRITYIRSLYIRQMCF